MATGSVAAGLPFLKADGKTVITSTEALALSEVPQSLLVVGAGAIGLEMGSIYRRLGTDVTVLEILPQILPGSDKEAVTRLERALKKQGLKIFTEMKIEAAVVEDGSVTLKGLSLKTNAPFEFKAEKVLLSAGRKPETADLCDGEPFLAMDRGFIKVDAALRTNVPGIYAIGDVIGGKLLAHKAYHDAIVAVENACGMSRTVDYAALPAAVFTEPEFASVGLTQEEAVGPGTQGQVGRLPSPGERPGHDHGCDRRPGQGPGRRVRQGRRRPHRRPRRFGHDPGADHGRGQRPDARRARRHHLYPPDAVRDDRGGGPQGREQGAAHSEHLKNGSAGVENSRAILYNRDVFRGNMQELAIAFAVFGIMSAVMILVNYLLGPRRPNPAREKPFECGSPPLQASIGPVNLPFFLVALLFLLLDVEVVFFYPLAVAFRGRGLAGFAALGVFVLVLALGFVYAWKKGIFRWS